MDLKRRILADIKKQRSGCWLWLGPLNRSGYAQITHHYQHILVHRWMYEQYVGPIPPGLQVHHSCDHPACVRPDHLWVGTQGDNVADMVRKGRMGRVGARCGTDNPRAKFTDAEVEEYRRRYAAGGVSIRALAREKGISHPQMRRVLMGLSWSHVGHANLPDPTRQWRARDKRLKELYPDPALSYGERLELFVADQRRAGALNRMIQEELHLSKARIEQLVRACKRKGLL